MKVVTKLTVTLPDIPGSLGKLCDVFKTMGINIEGGMCPGGDEERTAAHFIVKDSDVEKARKAMSAVGMVQEKPLLWFELPNEPGSLGLIANTCGEAGVNIDYWWVTGMGKTAQLYIAVDDVEKAKKACKHF